MPTTPPTPPDSAVRIRVELVDVPLGAATDVLLAIEGYAERVYRDRFTNLDQQRRYNDLAAVVLPLREARDGAL